MLLTELQYLLPLSVLMSNVFPRGFPNLATSRNGKGSNEDLRDFSGGEYDVVGGVGDGFLEGTPYNFDGGVGLGFLGNP